MSNVRVCVRFRPLNSAETAQKEEMLCIKALDDESFLFKAAEEDELAFCFDKVFYQDSKQEDVYEFLARPVVEDTVNLTNGTIIVYGQTGAGKTYTMEGPYISNCEENRKGLLPRVIDGLFSSIASIGEMDSYIVRLTMVEIYMEKVRDLLDLTKDNLQIKEGKMQGIFLSGVTEIPILDNAHALTCIMQGISNRTVGETQMNMSSSRSHCLYIFSVQKVSPKNERSKNSKLVLVDLAGSEKVEKTGAEGKILEEAKTINKSLSSLGNVVNALTSGKANHIPYRDSKLTRILQDALGGNSRCALLCCCSPSCLNASESLSTLRFGTRSKLLKTVSPMNIENQKQVVTSEEELQVNTRMMADEEKQTMLYAERNSLCCKIIDKLRESLSIENVNLLEELFMLEGIMFDPVLSEGIQSAYEDVASRTISLLQQSVKELQWDLHKLKLENNILKAELAFVIDRINLKAQKSNFLCSILDTSSTFFMFPFLLARRILIGH